MSLTLTLHPKVPRRDAILAALSLEDDGSRTFEIGRVDTGATCVLVDDAEEGWHLLLPLLRAPSSARDLLPAVASAIPLGLADKPLSIDELLALWDMHHREACRELIAMCEAQGSPPPPHLPRAELDALHGWLVARKGKPVLGIDFQEGGPVVLAVPEGDELAAHVATLRDVDGVTRLFLPGDEEGLSLARARIVTPVEIVDVESLTPR